MLYRLILRYNWIGVVGAEQLVNGLKMNTVSAAEVRHCSDHSSLLPLQTLEILDLECSGSSDEDTKHLAPVSETHPASVSLRPKDHSHHVL